MPSGGPRKPASPAPVSGPGRLSRRTDGGPGQVQRSLPNAEYGEQGFYSAIQSGAPLALAEGALTPSSGATGTASPSPMPVTPFNAPTQYPGQPVTSGADIGPGFGSDALGLVNENQLREEDRKKLVAYLPVLEYLANLPTAMPSMRAQVRKIRASVNNGVV
jgi:hypothetical protein